MLQLNKELEDTYQLKEEIGSGGGGTVYKAWHKRLQKDVVLKKTHSKLTKSASINVRAETDILKNLKHEYLPQVLDFFEMDGDVYTVMDYIPGESFKNALAEGKRFSPNQILTWFDQLCQAVERLHSQTPPIIHGDIKPDNIMLTPEGNICLIDFNVSGDFEEKDVVGYTPGYAAPEQIESFLERKNRKHTENSVKAVQNNIPQAKDDKTETDDYTISDDETETDDHTLSDDGTEVDDHTLSDDGNEENHIKSDISPVTKKSVVDVRSDIYSMGATIYHLLTGEKPGADKIKPLKDYKIKVDAAFAYIVMKCLEKNPEKRYQTVAQLHKAVKNVYLSSKAYKQLLRRQFILKLILAVGTIGFAALAGFGHLKMAEEKSDKYYSLVAQEKEAREKGDYEEADDIYLQAVSLFPERPDAYLEKVYALYGQKDYKSIIEFVYGLTIDETENPEAVANIYYIYGNCYMELENYDYAVDAFAKSVSLSDSNATVYRDYAISLARSGKIEEAQKQLEQAGTHGLETDAIYYTQGEIEAALGNNDAAAERFMDCIEATKDDYMKMRSYIMCSTMLAKAGNTQENLNRIIELLNDALTELPDEYKNVIFEILAQTYMNMAEVTDDTEYNLKAIQVFEEIIGYGWATYTTYHNQALLYQKNGLYEEGKNVLLKMLNLYGDNYNTYKRLAFIEVNIQAQLPNESRDYQQFRTYYDEALALYEEQLSGNETDMEMAALKDIYDQAVQGGWIKEESE